MRSITCLLAALLMATGLSPAVADNASDAFFVVSGPNGAVWEVDTSFNAGRVDDSGAVTEAALPLLGALDKPIWEASPLVDANGTLWVAAGDVVVRATPAGAVAWQFPGRDLGLIRESPLGGVWLAAADAVLRLTDAGTATFFPASPDEPFEVANDGAVWFSQCDDPSCLTVARLSDSGDMRKAAVAKPTEAIVPTGTGSAWVSSTWYLDTGDVLDENLAVAQAGVDYPLSARVVDPQGVRWWHVESSPLLAHQSPSEASASSAIVNDSYGRLIADSVAGIWLVKPSMNSTSVTRVVHDLTASGHLRTTVYSLPAGRYNSAHRVARAVSGGFWLVDDQGLLNRVHEDGTVTTHAVPLSPPTPTPQPPDAPPPPTPAAAQDAPGVVPQPSSAPALPGRIPSPTVKRKGARVAISWPAVSGASAYRVRISRPKGGKWQSWRQVTSTRIVFTKLAKKAFQVQIVAVGAGGQGPASTIRLPRH